MLLLNSIVGDERLRNFPFPTRRPTQSELLRCLNELTHAKVSHLTEDTLRAQDEAYLASLPKPKPIPAPSPAPIVAPKPVVPKLSKEEEARQEKWSRLVDMVTRGRVEAFKDLWQREGENLGGINARVPEREATLLHISARAGQEEMTQVLLRDFRADPTIPVGEQDQDEDDDNSGVSDAPPPISTSSRRVAYDLARTRGVRNVFRRSAAAHPDWWDWLGAARVPSILSQEMEQEQEERKKTRRKRLKDKIRERQAKQEEPSPTPSPPPDEPAPVKKKPVNEEGPRKLGGHSGAQESVAGLTPEMRAKIERERRARAAEARIKALGGA